MRVASEQGALGGEVCGESGEGETGRVEVVSARQVRDPEPGRPVKCGETDIAGPMAWC